MNTTMQPVSFSRHTRFWLTLFTLACIIWLGGIVFRAMIANEFFIPGTLVYEPNISLDQERTLFQLIAASSIVVLSAYLIVLVSAIFVLRLIPLKRREHGWLLMVSIMFFMFVPVELFTGYLDVHFIVLWFQTLNLLDVNGLQSYAQHSTLLRTTLSHRIGALSGLPVMATLCYFTSVVLIVWQPLRFRRDADIVKEA